MFHFDATGLMQFQQCEICIPRLAVLRSRNSRSVMLCKRRGSSHLAEMVSPSAVVWRAFRTGSKREEQLLLQECFYLCTSNVEISLSTLDYIRMHDERWIKTNSRRMLGVVRSSGCLNCVSLCDLPAIVFQTCNICIFLDPFILSSSFSFFSCIHAWLIISNR